ncbi:DNA excision repair protein (rad2) [Pochonia chlamydosporia 170]|uniref:DNA excision repair protein (Rad2) n=1 Tax=Pochonia chlamydosporia 170 TaxID=1380566 RepID=A0A179FMT1_METCM|nr:DNA excision repair protein (rad2) [Pochonia chlamydosporia 170]OAQ66874.1 DNA excision repair protein (rad2) [Pochonia chlamydosporia 170]
MGVNGLWTVVQPCARPTNLATLNRKRLAVDASIWIYQFLKAVRDKEGNALRNSHVVGFFRRICKLLWFGIQPVFVFDGGAPALKRATIQKRQRRREGRRDDAVRTAGKLLAVQMQRIAVEEEERRKRADNSDFAAREEEALREEIPDPSKIAYVDEIGMTQKEKMQSRRFHKQDAYHLPELDGGIASMAKPDDPRIMSIEELEEYARQFHNGEDINLYDFSKIDFDGDFFKSLPPPDRYNILNAARLRSRLRMGLSKDQLDDMFPDRMAFSRFQIERVKERNHLTQRLMYEVGMTGTDLTLGVNARVAGEKDREYILVKNDGVEGGWALGVVSKEKDMGEAHKPIDVDAIQVQYQTKDEQDAEEEDDDDFEDVPIEGLNRLPKPAPFSTAASLQAAQEIAARRQQYYSGRKDRSVEGEDGEDSLFVGGNTGETLPVNETTGEEALHPEEEDDLNRAIAMSLKNQHELDNESENDEPFEDVPVNQPEWAQKAVDAPRPIIGKGGSMIAHIVNNRANASVPKRKEEKDTADSDSEDDMQTLLAKSRVTKRAQPKPVFENKKNPFDGPLPFPKLDWGSSLFSKRPAERDTNNDVGASAGIIGDKTAEDDMAGGFVVDKQADDEPAPLPPWLANDTDIRDSLKKQQDIEREINAEDKMEAEEEERLRRKEFNDRLIEIDSSSDDGSDIQIIEIPPSPTPVPAVLDGDETRGKEEGDDEALATSESPEPEFEDVQTPQPSREVDTTELHKDSESPEPVFENVPPAEASSRTPMKVSLNNTSSSPIFEDVPAMGAQVSNAANATTDPDDPFADLEYDEFSDPEDEALMAQMAEEAEEHARFASELNNKSAEQNREDYEKELRQLRNQQKKDRRDADEVTQVMITECQALLRLFGIPYITAPMEAEAQCAELVTLGIVDGIVTDDSDTFLFGGTRVYKNMFNSNKFVECYISSDLEKELSLSRDQMISLAQLLGSDYTEGLPGVGPVTAVEILSEFPGKTGLENFREWWTAVQSQSRPKEADASSPFRKKFRKAQATKLFLPPGFPNPAVYDAYLHPEVDDSAEPFQWGVPDLEGLRRFLTATIGWSKERTDEVLVPVIRDMNKRDIEGTQSNITRYFGGGVGVGAKEAFAPRANKVKGSKRMAAAVEKLRANVGDESGEGSSKRRRRDLVDE